MHKIKNIGTKKLAKLPLLFDVRRTAVRVVRRRFAVAVVFGFTVRLRVCIAIFLELAAAVSS